METSIVEEILTDGGKVYAVIFIDGINKCVIHAIDGRGARFIQSALLKHACDADIQVG